MADSGDFSLEVGGAKPDLATSKISPRISEEPAPGSSTPLVDASAAMTGGPSKGLVATRFDNIDTLRAAAILIVMAYHYTAAYPVDYYLATEMPYTIGEGDIGVELFFVVSGYCISMTLLRAKSVVDFWCKRFARLHPAYVASVILTFVVVAAYSLPGREVSWPVAARNLFWSPIFNDDMVDGVYWSLLVELKFYFWLGVLHYVLPRVPLTVTWGLFTAFGLAMAQTSEIWANRLLIASLAPTFLIGIAAYERTRIGRSGVAVAILLALAAMLLTERYQGRLLLVAGVTLAAFVVLQVQFKAPRALVWIGLISYPLYLVHQNIGLVVIRETAFLIGPIYVRIGVAIAVALLLATVLHHTVELRYQRPLAAFFQRLLGLCTAVLPRFGRKRDEAAEAVTW